MTAALSSIRVAVLMRKERVPGAMSRWQTWRWVLADVMPDEDSFGEQPRCLYRSEQEERWLHPGFRVELFRDDAEGYYLNASTAAPCWFVMWRMEEEAGLAAEPVALPQAVSLSYHDAGRWLDAQETVEQIPAPLHVVEGLRAFVDEHHKAEPKRRQRPESFKTLQDRFGNPVSISTEKKSGRGGNG